MQFFPDRPAAVREMRRALDGRGRLLVAVWKSLDEVPFIRDLHTVAERHLGAFVDRRHGFGDPAALEQLIAEGGFHDVHVESVTCRIRFAESTMFVRLNSNAVVGMGVPSSTMSNDERNHLAELIAEDAADVVRQYSDGDGLAFELGANVVTARLNGA
jgi:hypothetical protein